MRRVLMVSGLAVVAAAAVVGAVVAPGFVTARSTAQPADTPSASASSSVVSDGPIRTAVVGDSLSAGASKFLGNGLDENSWMKYAQGRGVEYAGGWAKAGALPQEMAAAVRPVHDVDVLVILAGTNTVGRSATFTGDEASFRKIVKTIDPKRVVVSAIPPFGPNEPAAVRYNRALEQFAVDEGWTFTDPWGFARRGTNGEDWKPGISVDTVHPGSARGYEQLGDALHATIVSVGRRVR